MLGASTNDAITFRPIQNKSAIDLLCPAFYVPEMLRRVDLFPDLESEVSGFRRAVTGYSNTISADDRIIHDLEVVTNSDQIRLAGMDLQIRQNLSKGVAGGLGLGLFLAGAAWIVSSALVPSSSYPAVPIVLGSIVAATGGTIGVILILPEAKKVLK